MNRRILTSDLAGRNSDRRVYEIKPLSPVPRDQAAQIAAAKAKRERRAAKSRAQAK